MGLVHLAGNAWVMHVALDGTRTQSGITPAGPAPPRTEPVRTGPKSPNERTDSHDPGNDMERVDSR